MGSRPPVFGVRHINLPPFMLFPVFAAEQFLAAQLPPEAELQEGSPFWGTFQGNAPGVSRSLRDVRPRGLHRCG